MIQTERATARGQSAGKRVLKPQQRRQEILDAALRLFNERGFESTTVADIARAAGAAKGTVYLYFPSKEDVLRGLYEAFYQGLGAHFTAIITRLIEDREAGAIRDYRDAIDRVFDGLISYSLENRDLCRLLIDAGPQLHRQRGARAEDEFVHFMAQSFEEATRQGRMHTSDPDMTAFLLNAALTAGVTHAFAYEDRFDLERVVAATREMFYKALAPEGSLPPRALGPSGDD
ncbi:MAG: TetR/AcrR family transcriptional regulator [Actinomycetota bacterium]|nr:TetR/AcrR family transcriptional regulator [Actinomycetota bacterium]